MAKVLGPGGETRDPSFPHRCQQWLHERVGRDRLRELVAVDEERGLERLEGGDVDGAPGPPGREAEVSLPIDEESRDPLLEPWSSPTPRPKMSGERPAAGAGGQLLAKART